MRHRARPWWRVGSALLAACLSIACAEQQAAPGGDPNRAVIAAPAASGGDTLHEVRLPDLSKATPSVQSQIQSRWAAAREAAGRPGDRAALAAAYGELGKVLLAAQYREAAEPAMLNAQALQSDDVRWTYYLGHLYRGAGDLPKARVQFERALQLQPNDVATLVWLGDIHLSEGRPADAAPLFEKALAVQPTSLSARFGLGRAALEQQQYRDAVTHLHKVLARDPSAAAAHYPLAMAYRALGDAARAERHLRQREDHQILPADPLMVELDELLESAQAYESRGIRALDQKDWNHAAALFRKGLALEPQNASLHHRLGTVLAMNGDQRGARQEFETAVRLAPENHLAQYSLGVLLQSSGDHAGAIERFTAALQHRPGYVEARLRLAASLRRSGRAAEAPRHYQEVLAANPDATEARFGEAIALMQIGRYAEARDRLQAARKLYPGEPLYAHALARLLAAAPDDRLRDGARAMAIVEELLQKEQRTIDLGETFAMSLAAQGRFEQAAAVQRDLIAAVKKGGLEAAVPRLEANLALYERREPCRTPWTEDQMP